jgi:hypothetical protein
LWAAADLEQKLRLFQNYFNRGLDLKTLLDAEFVARMPPVIFGNSPTTGFFEIDRNGFLAMEPTA